MNLLIHLYQTTNETLTGRVMADKTCNRIYQPFVGNKCKKTDEQTDTVTINLRQVRISLYDRTVQT